MLVEYEPACYRLFGRSVSDDDFLVLRGAADRSALKRARVCIHKSEHDPIQEMFVVLLKETIKGTYRYQRDSSKVLLRGRMHIEFIESGEVVAMNRFNPFIKIEAGVYHRPVILSDYVVLYEAHQGPWTPAFMEQKKKTREEIIAYEREHGING